MRGAHWAVAHRAKRARAMDRVRGARTWPNPTGRRTGEGAGRGEGSRGRGWLGAGGWLPRAAPARAGARGGWRLRAHTGKVGVGRRAAMSVADAAAVGGRGWGRDGARRASGAVQAQRGEEEGRGGRGRARSRGRAEERLGLTCGAGERGGEAW